MAKLYLRDFEESDRHYVLNTDTGWVDSREDGMLRPHICGYGQLLNFGVLKRQTVFIGYYSVDLRPWLSIDRLVFDMSHSDARVSRHTPLPGMHTMSVNYRGARRYAGAYRQPVDPESGESLPDLIEHVCDHSRRDEMREWVALWEHARRGHNLGDPRVQDAASRLARQLTW